MTDVAIVYMQTKRVLDTVRRQGDIWERSETHHRESIVFTDYTQILPQIRVMPPLSDLPLLLLETENLSGLNAQLIHGEVDE